MAYTFGARLDDDSFALTTIDEDQGTASTKGEINGVPFESGGGGSSDFSTATLTIIDPNELLTALYVPCVSGGVADFRYEGDPTEGITVILAEGKAWTEVETDGGTITLAGNITAEGRRYLITGDCTITIS